MINHLQKLPQNPPCPECPFGYALGYVFGLRFCLFSLHLPPTLLHRPTLSRGAETARGLLLEPDSPVQRFFEDFNEPQFALLIRALLADRGGGADEPVGPMFITSANFTPAAHRRNIEVGVVIRQSTLVQSLDDYFHRLQETRQIAAIPR